MKATLRAPLLKVNINVELCQGSRADGRVCRYGTQWADPGLGQSPLRVHRTTAWDRGRSIGTRMTAWAERCPLM